MATIQWVDPNGKMAPLRSKPAIYGNSNPTFSPDGTRLSLAIRQGASEDIWAYDPQRDAITRLTSGGVNQYPVWSHDGQYIVFAKPYQGIFQVRADGASPAQPLTESSSSLLAIWPFSFSPV
jgi:Tol biopolymer transport system component